MRIVGGKHRGRQIAAPPGLDTRPTSDRAREGVFNILAHGDQVDLQGARVIDLFAGSGAMGLESLSRGAERVLFVDRDRGARTVIEDNLRHLDETGAASVVNMDGTGLPARGVTGEVAGLVFIDPPYGKNMIAPALGGLIPGQWLGDGAVIVVEFGKADEFDIPAQLELFNERHYGEAHFRFLCYAAE